MLLTKLILNLKGFVFFFNLWIIILEYELLFVVKVARMSNISAQNLNRAEMSIDKVLVGVFD